MSGLTVSSSAAWRDWSTAANAAARSRAGRRGSSARRCASHRPGEWPRARTPRQLGTALSNPHVTTDYSEALLELVTPTFRGKRALTHYLGEPAPLVVRRLGDEVLWAASMPGEIVGRGRACRSRRHGRSHRGTSRKCTGVACRPATAA